MDRRQKKTREAIFTAFTSLLSKKQYHQITVQDILDAADVGRTTFYAHFETKEYLLLPVRSAIQKHSLNIINSDTTIKFSRLGEKAGTIGSCMLSRSKLLGLL